MKESQLVKSRVAVSNMVGLRMTIGGLLLFAFACNQITPSAKPTLLTNTPKTTTVFPTETVDASARFTATSPRPFRSTGTEIPSLIWTPIPTLESSQRDKFVIDLLTNNNHCLLPCWWGSIPGETRWDVAKHFLGSFATRIEQGAAGYIEENGAQHVVTNYSVYYDIPGTPTEGYVLYSLRDDIINTIRVFPPGTHIQYQLSQVLSSFGKPSEVFLYVDNGPSGIFFQLGLLYSGKGIFAHYTYQGKKEQSEFRSCPQPIGADLRLWSPMDKSTSDKIFQKVQGDFVTRLKTATNLDIDDFYQIFKDSNKDACLTSPIELWP